MVKNSHTSFISSCIKQISKDKDLENKSTRDCKRDVLKDISCIKQISKDKDLKNKSTRDCKRNILKDQIPGHDEGKDQSIKLEVGQHEAHGQVVESLIDLVMINNQDTGVDTPGQVFSQEVGVETQGSTPG